MKHDFQDYEKDIEARDRARDFWYGCLVFAALITIASLFACEQEPLNPELSNALTLEPIMLDALIECKSPGCQWLELCK